MDKNIRTLTTEGALEIRRMAEKDIGEIHEGFNAHRIRKPLDYIRSCWEENLNGERISLLAFYEGAFAGSLHLLRHTHYAYFADNGIPEIVDFNVIPPLRRLGIGRALMDAVEAEAAKDYAVVGIGVGLYDNYGSAQRLYAQRGYIPDGRGVMYKQHPVPRGSQVLLDDDLNLYFTKQLRGE